MIISLFLEQAEYILKKKICVRSSCVINDIDSYVVRQLISRTRHCVLAMATVDKSLSMV